MSAQPRYRAILLAVGALALVLTSCADTPEEAAGPDASAAPSGTPADSTLEPVRVGFISQEKELLSIGEARVAAEAGVAYVNAELGGVNGHPVELEVCLAGDSPESAVSCAEKLINDESILMAITATYSDPAVLRLASKSGLPVITTNTTPKRLAGLLGLGLRRWGGLVGPGSRNLPSR